MVVHGELIPTVQVTVLLKGYEQDQMANKRLAEVLIKLDKAERNNNAIARFDLPEALNGLKSGKGPRWVTIAFFPDDEDENHEALRRKLQGYFPRTLVRDVEINGESIYATACS